MILRCTMNTSCLKTVKQIILTQKFVTDGHTHNILVMGHFGELHFLIINLFPSFLKPEWPVSWSWSWLYIVMIISLAGDGDVPALILLTQHEEYVWCG